ncbi:MAG: DUF5663 domain-containing protein [Thermodesulfobacteriota bacterium]
MDQRKNPYIENFCRALVQRREKDMDQEAMERMVESLYNFFENRLGRNLVSALPEEQRTEFISLYDKGTRDLDEETVRRLFANQDIDQVAIMRKTMQEVAELYFRNRPGDTPPPWAES